MELGKIYKKGKETLLAKDGGFRRGSDVLKGLAFGASLVGLGRPILYGLAADGQQGVQDVVTAINGELKRILSMVGAPDVRYVERNVILRIRMVSPFRMLPPWSTFARQISPG
ncbi:MAG: hypothetical protein B1H13_14170 [Desulfobacteraceae bacterium 4484_190.3]|nr:MAG: hypothetical protein B1H13_14170 [Desulfobacteraceae bacterium 4484_190.3]